MHRDAFGSAIKLGDVVAFPVDALLKGTVVALGEDGYRRRGDALVKQPSITVQIEGENVPRTLAHLDGVLLWERAA